MKETLAQIFGIIMTISFMFCYVPQIVTIYKNKFSRGLSLGLILMSICGYISGMAYMFLTQFGIWWFANYSVGLIMCIVLVYAWFKFRKNQFFKILCAISLAVEQVLYTDEVGSSILSSRTIFGGVAHLVEQDLCKVKVAGSSPVTSKMLMWRNWQPRQTYDLFSSEVQVRLLSSALSS